MEIQQRKMREAEDWRNEVDKRWNTIKCCLELVEGGEEGTSTRRMEERKRRKEFWSEEIVTRHSFIRRQPA